MYEKNLNGYDCVSKVNEHQFNPLPFIILQDEIKSMKKGFLKIFICILTKRMFQKLKQKN